MTDLYRFLEDINYCPKPFENYTAASLWTDEHISAQMLALHLDPDVAVSSRRAEFMDRSVAWICDRFKVSSETRIADFGCGPGLNANRLARYGARVTGIDFSARSIEHARVDAEKEGLPARYVCEDYLAYDTDERFDLILMIMCDYCALSPRQRQMMLAKFRSLLSPGGSVLLDVYSLAAFAQQSELEQFEPKPGGGFWSGNPHYVFQKTAKYDQEKVTLDKFTIVEAGRIRTIYNWIQYFSPESLCAEFEVAGLSPSEVLGDVAGAGFDVAAREFAVVARTDKS